MKTIDQITFSEHIKPISLPITDFPDKSDMLAVVSGFGSPYVSQRYTSLKKMYLSIFSFTKKPPQHIMEAYARSHILQFQSTKTLATVDCKKRYSDDEYMRKYSDFDHSEIDHEFICTDNEDGKGMCLGDTGNPLVDANTLVEISSWYIESSTQFPNGYTKIYKYLDWIKKEMKN